MNIKEGIYLKPRFTICVTIQSSVDKYNKLDSKTWVFNLNQDLAYFNGFVFIAQCLFTL
jgi:hypothetical protein